MLNRRVMVLAISVHGLIIKFRLVITVQGARERALGL